MIINNTFLFNLLKNILLYIIDNGQFIYGLIIDFFNSNFIVFLGASYLGYISYQLQQQNHNLQKKIFLISHKYNKLIALTTTKEGIDNNMMEQQAESVKNLLTPNLSYSSRDPIHYELLKEKRKELYKQIKILESEIKEESEILS